MGLLFQLSLIKDVEISLFDKIKILNIKYRIVKYLKCNIYNQEWRNEYSDLL